MEFLKELHKNKRIKIRLCIAIFLAFMDPVALTYLAYVIITEILRFMSRRDMPFLNSIFVKIFLIAFLSGIADFLSKGKSDNEGWSIIIAYMIIAFMLEQPFKFFVKRESEKRRRKKYGLDYDFIEEERELELKTGKNAQFEKSESQQFSITLKDSKKMKKGFQSGSDSTAYSNEYETLQNKGEGQQRLQYKVSVCPSCGFRNKIILGNVESCEYCGSPID